MRENEKKREELKALRTLLMIQKKSPQSEEKSVSRLQCSLGLIYYPNPRKITKVYELATIT